MRILILSDLHANYHALDAILRAAGQFDQIWCLGDVVGYGPEPNECIERLRAFDLVCLAGNHDLAVAEKLGLDDFNPDAREAVYWTRTQITYAHTNWLAALPTHTTLAAHGITLVHGSPRDAVWEYIMTPPVARACLAQMETPIGFNGHTHVPYLFGKPLYESGVIAEPLPARLTLTQGGDRWLINPGSAGQPRDEDPRAAYALLDLATLTLTHHRVQYDVAATQKLMKQAQLPSRLIRRLRFGQ